MDKFSLDYVLGLLTEITITYAPKIIMALVILFIGLWLIKRVVKQIDKRMKKNERDVSLRNFLVSFADWTLKLLLFITVISQLGVPASSFLAIFASAGLAVGLALQGSLANFAGGVLIMIFRPFKVGDKIEAQGQVGDVKEISIFTTKLISADNKLIIIPNGPLSNDTITNYTEEGKMRVDLVIGVGYDEDIKQSKEVLMQVLQSNDLVLKDPAPSVNVSELADSSVNFAVRPFCKPEHYWDVYFKTLEDTKIALDKAGIEIPYPHAVEIVKGE